MIGAPLPAGASSAAIARLATLLEAHTGQGLAASRAWRVDIALKPLVAECGLRTIDQLVARLDAGKDAAIGERIVDALLNQETSFFRDPGTIEGLVAALAENGVMRPRLWSAGCATGQEPLSLAMALAGQDRAGEIVATDVSGGAIARARAGRYTRFEIQRGLPVRQMLHWFVESGANWVARPELLAQISYRRHNLVEDPPPAGRFDAVLCRNVLLDLAPTLRARVLDRLAAALRPGGLLVLGAGETVSGQSRHFTPSARFRGFYTRDSG